MSILIILSLFLLLTTTYTDAQLSLPPSNSVDNTAPYSRNLEIPTVISIVVLILGISFLIFFTVNLCRSYLHDLRSSSPSSAAAGAAAPATASGARRGLDPAILETFPTFSYSVLTNELELGTEPSPECAVCLMELSDDETVRMLPRCCHVFHLECIDMWLESHITCPVCRANLATVVPTSENSGPDEEEEVPEQPCEEEEEIVIIDIERMGRHADRFTVRLPEHVRRQSVGAGTLRRSTSMAVFRSGGERSLRRGCRRGRRSMQVEGGISERWAAEILSRVSLWRREEVENAGCPIVASSDGRPVSTEVSAKV